MNRKTILAVVIGAAFNGQALAEETFTFDEVVVSATRSEQDKQDVSSSIESVSAEQISNELSMGLDDAVDNAVGVEATTSGRFGVSGFNIRGMDEDRVKVVVDGIKQPTPFNPGGGATQAIYPNAVEVDTLKAIEVNKGPASTLYGSDALGGAVVMTTKDPSDVLVTDGDEHRFGIKSGYQSKDEQFKNTLTWAMRKGDLETILIGTYAQGQELENYGNGLDVEGPDRTAVDPAEKDLNNVLAKAYYTLNEAHKVGVVFERYESTYDEERLSANKYDDYSNYMGMNLGHFGYDNSTSLDETTRTRYGINHEWQANNVAFDNLLWQLNYQLSETRNENYSDMDIADNMGWFGYPAGFSYQGGRNRVRQAEDTTWQLDAQFDKLVLLNSSTHELTYGANFVNTDFALDNQDIFLEDSSLNQSGSTTIPDAQMQQWGAFVQDNAFFFNDALVVTAGLRYDAFEADPSTDDAFTTENEKNSDSAFTTRLGVVWHFNDTFNTFAQFSQGFKAPTVEQLYYEYDIGSDFTPNSELGAERSDSYELGLRGQNERFSFELVAFYNDYSDFIATEQLEEITSGKDHYTLVNLDAVTIKGAEFSSTVQLGAGFYTGLDVAYADGEDETTGEALNSVAPLTTRIDLGYNSANQRYGMLVSYEHVATKDDYTQVEDLFGGDPSDNIDAPAYNIVDVTAYYRPMQDLTLRAGLFNATDEEYWDYNDLAGKTEDSDITGYSQPGRNWGVSAEFYF